MKKLKKFAKSKIGLLVIVVGVASFFVPDPIPFVDEAAGVILAALRYLE